MKGCCLFRALATLDYEGFSMRRHALRKESLFCKVKRNTPKAQAFPGEGIKGDADPFATWDQFYIFPMKPIPVESSGAGSLGFPLKSQLERGPRASTVLLCIAKTPYKTYQSL
ncbi:hypothetical protein HAX54_026168 [Datura stramonium]|uniref:Uncharacterized protein n=1 Tax=Datura stramonium TaxID=4076 RepID=A0ABS8S6S9_DATST|nr:hypothetical protein [Datura stramonium]